VKEARRAGHLRIKEFLNTFAHACGVKPGIVFPALLLLAACQQAEPVDRCTAALEELDTCLLVNREATAFDVLTQCVPLSQLQRIEGTWALDFGLNAFYESQQLSSDQARAAQAGAVRLVYRGTQLEEWVVGELATVAQISFYGRRPLCGLDEQFSYLLVERVASRKIVEQTRSQAYPEPDWEPKNLGHADPFDQTKAAP